VPTYQYPCKECGRTFERTETISEHEVAKPQCPKGGGKRVRCTGPRLLGDIKEELIAAETTNLLLFPHLAYIGPIRGAISTSAIDLTELVDVPGAHRDATCCRRAGKILNGSLSDEEAWPISVRIAPARQPFDRSR